MTDHHEKGLSDLLATLRGISQTFLMACAAILFIVVTILSTERYRSAKSDIDLIQGQVDLAVSSFEQPIRAESADGSLEDSSRAAVSAAMTSVKSGSEEEIHAFVEDKVKIRCTGQSAPCTFTCRTRQTIPSKEKDSLATWLAFLASPPEPFVYYSIESGSTAPQLPTPQFNQVSGDAVFYLYVNECRVAEGSSSGGGLVTIEIPLRMDNSTVNEQEKLALNIEQTLAFQARRRPAALGGVGAETVAAIARLNSNDEELLRLPLEQCSERLDSKIEESSQSIDVVGVDVSSRLVSRFAAYFLWAYSCYLALYFFRLRRYALPNNVTYLRESTWFPLFPCGLHLGIFVVVLLLGPVLATRPDLVAALMGDRDLMPSPEWSHFIGVFAGVIAAASALWGLYPLRSLIFTKTEKKPLAKTEAKRDDPAEPPFDLRR